MHSTGRSSKTKKNVKNRDRILKDLGDDNDSETTSTRKVKKRTTNTKYNPDEYKKEKKQGDKIIQKNAKKRSSTKNNLRSRDSRSRSLSRSRDSRSRSRSRSKSNTEKYRDDFDHHTSRSSRSSSRSRYSEGEFEFRFDEKKWLEDLRQFLKENIIPNTTKNKEIQEQLISDDAMKIWSIAFTHSSINPNKGENYEILEKIGDKVIGLMFLVYLLEKHPDFGTRELSELSNVYLGKEHLALISNRLGFTRHARTKIRNINLEEDIFESIFGAIIVMGNKNIVKKGLEYLLCEKFFRWIFENHVEIDPEKAKGKTKTQVTQIFQKAKWGEIETSWDERTGTLVLYFSNKAIEDLRSKLDYHLSSNVLAEVKDKKTKTAAEEEAYKIALQRLTEMNITMENARAIFGDDLFENKEMEPLFPEFAKKLKDMGVSSYSFKVFFKGGKEIKVQLLGFKDETKEYIILAESDGDSILRAKMNAIREFLKK